MPVQVHRIATVTLLTLGLASCSLNVVDRDEPPGSRRTGPDFVDVSAQIGITRNYQPGETYGPLWGDLNGDGWLDLVFMNHGMMPSLYLNQSGSRFVDGFARSGIRSGDWQYPEQHDRHGGACADYDNDGDADLFITHGAKRGETLGIKRDELLNNLGDATFQDVTVEAGTPNSYGRARFPSWVDFDNDGWLDLYVANTRSRNVLYRNAGNGRFTDISGGSGVDHEQAESHAWIDYDDDGYTDLLLEWPIQTFVDNLALYRNNGSGLFSNVTTGWGARRRPVPGPRGLAVADYDYDGDTDFFAASAHSNHNRLYRNDKGAMTFVEGPFGPDELDTQNFGVAPVWGDIDNNGNLDVIMIDGNRLRRFESRIGTGLVEIPLAADVDLSLTRGSELALGDYDNDGYLDLAVNGLSRQYLLKNRHSGNSWLKISFKGSSSNRMGFGTKVRVSAQQQTITRTYMGDSGFYRSAGCGPLHIGLGESKSVDLTIRWPSGVEQRLLDVAVNRTIQIAEP